MPLFNSCSRRLQGFPIRPCAYANISRWCSSPSESLASEQLQHTHVQASPITTSGLSASHTPGSLDLGLNFATMDFDAVVRATHAAIARERSAGLASEQREQALEVKLDKEDGAPAPTQEWNPVTAPPAASSAEGAHQLPAPVPHYASPQQRRSDGDSPAPQPPQARLSPRSLGRERGFTRYSLQDKLKDCVADGSWARAFQLFTNAVEQACRQVLVPRGAPDGAAVSREADAEVTAADSGNLPLDTTREFQCFAALRKQLAPLPPTKPRERVALVKNMHGVMRWTGLHYYLLWKCLLEAGRLEELKRVWLVMERTGFAEYQMEERTVNAMMTLLRPTSQSTELVMATVVPPGGSMAGTASHQKGILRELVKSLEQAAAKRNFQLADVNRRTAEGVRIVEALKRAQRGCGGEGTAAHATAAPDEGEGATWATDSGEAAVAVAVGDFNGLLRRARTHEETDRILSMMAKLKIEREGITYASLIAALHNPQYVLPGHTAEELAAHQARGATSSELTATKEESRGAAKDTNISGCAHISADSSPIKTSYEAYRQERVKAGMTWFEACPPTHRTADVFNELLYLLRAKSHWSQFDAKLVQLRGNAVVAETEWPQTLAEAEPPVGTSVPAAQEAVHILAPHWATCPNGKTYELLIQRARYVHQWDVMWALYEEMITTGVRGTTRTYEVLLREAYNHPPYSVRALKHPSGGDATSRFLLSIYDELRRSGGDVHSLKDTLNVVSAWTTARSTTTRRYS
ncbi:hypothetical protein LSCM1_01758 [Leishmania martiniquensis]|uniref:Kinetoplast polyadenylation/uridylation factor 2 n=1 Tax=Leishmania martiniquensis TaxID=1580590 RepID=A0A836GE85_9TRYP|nr:hypothetical protein LSCM1_01758 [Leishmania martiniquensis]